MPDNKKYLPDKCPLCNERVPAIYANVRRDMPCANCGYFLVQATELLAVVKSVLAEQLGVDTATLDVDYSLSNELVTDSLDMVELVMDLEEKIPTQLMTESLATSEEPINSLNDVTIGNIVRSYCRRSVPAPS